MTQGWWIPLQNMKNLYWPEKLKIIVILNDSHVYFIKTSYLLKFVRKILSVTKKGHKELIVQNTS